MTAEHFGFNGCDRQDPDTCNCATWSPQICPLCDKEIVDGEDILIVTRDVPYLVEDDELQEYDRYIWHRACDPGTLAAASVDPPGVDGENHDAPTTTTTK
ncbi:hypothetical protein ACQI4L_09175 [Mycolicibacterium litorale]|uniref:hypothetical protein n=1 Tax=Mycolicibacterium litorale TaxID=758802 RepID=UPI003CEC2120